MVKLELPEYQSIKVVKAAKINQINGCVLTLEFDKTALEQTVSEDYLTKHSPKVGGYYVRYEGGYESYSPAEAFEKGYLPLSTAFYTSYLGTSFGIAIEMLREGHRMTRRGWNGKDMWVELQTPDEHSKMSLPYIYMRTADKQYVPWVASQTDMLAEDWVIVQGE